MELEMRQKLSREPFAEKIRKVGQLIRLAKNFSPPHGQTTTHRQMKTTEDVRKYAAEQGIAEEESLKKGMEAKSKEFVENGAEVYAKV